MKSQLEIDMLHRMAKDNLELALGFLEVGRLHCACDHALEAIANLRMLADNGSRRREEAESIVDDAAAPLLVSQSPISNLQS